MSSPSKSGHLLRLSVRSPFTAIQMLRIGLRVNIAVVFSFLIVILGTFLITFSFERHKVLAFETATDMFDHITRQTASGVSNLYAPAEALVNLTAELAPSKEDVATDHSRLLGYFAKTLQSNPQLAAVFIGFNNGDFHIVRVARDIESNNILAAPANTAFIVQNIQNVAGKKADYRTVYYDANLDIIKRNNLFATGYDPRARTWYRKAIAVEETITTDFYTFFTSKQIGTTVALRYADSTAVVAADITLENLSVGLNTQLPIPSTEIMIFDENGTVLGHSDSQWYTALTKTSTRVASRTPHISDLNNQVMDEMFHQFVGGNRNNQINLQFDDGDWFGSIRPVEFGPHVGEKVYMAILVPESEILKNLQQVRWHSVAISLVVLLLTLLIAWGISKHLANSARILSEEADQIRKLKLDTPITVRSRILEIDALARSMAAMKKALKQFTTISIATSSETNIEQLMRSVLTESMASCHAEYGSILWLSDDGKRLVRRLEISRNDPSPQAIDEQCSEFDSIELALDNSSLQLRNPELYSFLRGESLVIENTNHEQKFDLAHFPYESMVLIPLKSANSGIVGLLQFGDVDKKNHQGREKITPELIEYLESLASFSAASLENRRLIDSQHKSFESLIHIIAVAIDAKSPHTGGHCQRVPILAEALADSASKSSQVEFSNFNLSEAGKQELHIASWLHDCGKVTTPEHILNKATKLETVYNRIHEIRVRFEVLLRDAEIEYWETLAKNPNANEADARLKCERAKREIKDDFEFIAHCNIGTEVMTDQSIDRIHSISKRIWFRNLDNSLGLSKLERERMPPKPSKTQLFQEGVLADRPDHIVQRTTEGLSWGSNPLGFKMDIPEHESNFGEIHNLTIRTGTLTTEERFLINDHIVQTLNMLNTVQFPREYSRVSDIAGNHHEKMDGSGFPRKLSASDLTIEDRIIAIADIFEALTAPDRPYKSAKKLSESVRIMRDMCSDGKICGDLFNLFITSNIISEYATSHLAAEQIDAIDFSEFLFTKEDSSEYIIQ